MSKARDASFRKIVLDAIRVEAGGLDRGGGEEALARNVAKSVLERLHERGFAIHDVENCIRRPWQDREKVTGADRTRQDDVYAYGREMTPEERSALGVDVYDDVP